MAGEAEQSAAMVCEGAREGNGASGYRGTSCPLGVGVVSSVRLKLSLHCARASGIGWAGLC